MTYFGDDYLEFTDFLNSLSIPEVIEVQYNLNLPLIGMAELNYYSEIYKSIINRVKCVRELKKETDKTKKDKILEKYNLKPIDVKKPDYMM